MTAMIGNASPIHHRAGTRPRQKAVAVLAATLGAMVISVGFAPAAQAGTCTGPDGVGGRVVASEGGRPACVGVNPDGSYFNVELPITPPENCPHGYFNDDYECSPVVLYVVRRTH